MTSPERAGLPRRLQNELQGCFFRRLLWGRFSRDPAELAAAARTYGLPETGSYQPVYLHYRVRSPVWEDPDPAAETAEQVEQAARRAFAAFPDLWLVQITSNSLLLLLYSGGVPQAYRACETACGTLCRAMQVLGLDYVCQIGTAAALPDLAAHAQELLETGRDQVNLSGRLLSSTIERGRSQSPPQPNVDRLLTLMDSGMYQETMAAAREFFFHPEVQPLLNYSFLEHYKFQLLDGLRNLSAIRRLDVDILRPIPPAAVDMASTSVQDLLLLLELVCRQLALTKPIKSNSRNLFEVAKFHILDNLSDQLDRNTVAARFFVSPDYLDRIFRRACGQTVTGFILASRIALARELLSGSTMPISDVALRVGFVNFAHFSSVFHRIVGLTPKQYRASHTEV